MWFNKRKSSWLFSSKSRIKSKFSSKLKERTYRLLGICWFIEYSILGNISKRLDKCWRSISDNGDTNSHQCWIRKIETIPDQCYYKSKNKASRILLWLVLKEKEKKYSHFLCEMKWNHFKDCEINTKLKRIDWLT